MAIVIAFATLGMFTIDEIELYNNPDNALQAPSIASRKDIIGGAGTYAALGARMAGGRQESCRVGWVVDAGSDFPVTLKKIIESWNTTCVFRVDNSRLTTRAWNGFQANEFRAFRFLTPKLRLDEHSLPRTLLMASSFHMVCAAQRAMDLVNGIMNRRRLDCSENSRPFFIWEPFPESCTPSERQAFLQASRMVDIVSPNEVEFAGYFSDNSHTNEQTTAIELLKNGIGPDKDGVLIVRAGRHGCRAYYGDWTLQMPAYHCPAGEGSVSSSAVVDPTGGGNTFLGALGMVMGNGLGSKLARLIDKRKMNEFTSGWGKFHQLAGALACANVAASFAIQQTGVPEISSAEAEEDLWNGQLFEERFEKYVSTHYEHVSCQTRVETDL